MRMIFWRRHWQPTPVLLPGKSHGWRSLVGCSSWGREESDTTERLHFHFSLSCTGEGNGNPLQCSCLENPRDGGAWWAAVYGVAQSQTRLKQLSSSSAAAWWQRSHLPWSPVCSCSCHDVQQVAVLYGGVLHVWINSSGEAFSVRRLQLQIVGIPMRSGISSKAHL